ncbi:MAG: universal stress protein, partial [Janthinobacterium lividum]
VFAATEIEWHSSLSFAPPSNYVVQQVKNADLVLTGTPALDGSNTSQTIASSLVMNSGRPIIIVPEPTATASLDRIMVAWRNTPESRRAVLGALPLLQRAAEVTLVEVASDEGLPAARQELADTSHWLAEHGITTKIISARALDDVGEQLVTLAHDIGANLIVAGAYGHSRLREWAFGGVTRYILQRADGCVLLSH